MAKSLKDGGEIVVKDLMPFTSEYTLNAICGKIFIKFLQSPVSDFFYVRKAFNKIFNCNKSSTLFSILFNDCRNCHGHLSAKFGRIPTTVPKCDSRINRTTTLQVIYVYKNNSLCLLIQVIHANKTSCFFT